ncbi:MAG: hypothetical protein HKN70_10620 [Gammaproteobacteria bacterium]|nr:hypothetical protein [Gammaproteobacteria bacterium]
MSFVVAHIKTILLICGALTCTMVTLVIAPGTALQWFFGATVDGDLALFIARNFGAVVTLLGIALIWCAWQPQYRPVVLVLATAGKLMFVITTLLLGGSVLKHAALALGADLVMIVFFVIYLNAYSRGLAQQW